MFFQEDINIMIGGGGRIEAWEVASQILSCIDIDTDPNWGLHSSGHESNTFGSLIDSAWCDTHCTCGSNETFAVDLGCDFGVWSVREGVAVRESLAVELH